MAAHGHPVVLRMREENGKVCEYAGALGAAFVGESAMHTTSQRPARGEVGDYYFTYIDQVADGDIRELLTAQATDALEFFRSIPEARTLHRYAPGKWSIREVLAHVNDCERLFAFRAFWFARGFETPLPSFEQEIAAAAAGADERSWRSHVDEFTVVRAATMALFRELPEAAWRRTGIASGNPFSVRSLAYVAVGHVNHHIRIVKAAYL
jgi:hypothetical protein